MNEGEFVLAVTLGFILGLFTMFGVNSCALHPAIERQFRQEAIEVGAAEYVVDDPLTGATRFRWKEPANDVE